MPPDQIKTATRCTMFRRSLTRHRSMWTDALASHLGLAAARSCASVFLRQLVMSIHCAGFMRFWYGISTLLRHFLFTISACMFQLLVAACFNILTTTSRLYRRQRLYTSDGGCGRSIHTWTTSKVGLRPDYHGEVTSLAQCIYRIPSRDFRITGC